MNIDIGWNKHSVTDKLYETASSLILICALWGGMCQDGVIA